MGGLKKLRKHFARALGRGTIGWLGRAMLAVLAKTWRIEHVGRESFVTAREEGPGCFFSVWHGRMIVALPMFAHKGCHVLVSASGDGDISEKLLEANGYSVIRGSSSRGGARALRQMLKVLDEGAVLFITPDGPRGPMHSMNPGLAFMAKATGRSVVPLGLAINRAWHASSWDHFTIPKPFARICFVYGEAVSVAREASPEEQSAATDLVRERTLQAEREGFARLGCDPDWLESPTKKQGESA